MPPPFLLMIRTKPQFHRTETWLSCAFLFPRLFLVLGLVWDPCVLYLEVFNPVSDAVLMPDTLDPFSSADKGIECLSIRLKLLIPSFNSLNVFPWVLTREILRAFIPWDIQDEATREREDRLAMNTPPSFSLPRKFSGREFLLVGENCNVPRS